MKTAAKPRPATSAKLDERDKKHLRRCLDDFEFYARYHLRIRTKKGRLEPFFLNSAQRIVHNKIADQFQRIGKVRVIVLKARQEGISTYTAGRFFRRCHLNPYQRVAVIAHEKDKSSDIFEFYDRMYQNLMDEMKPGVLSSQRGNVLHMKHDSQIVVDTANDPEAARSTTLQGVHCSEVARWRNAEEVMVSVFNAIGESDTEIIIESTAQGVGNVFHQEWEKAEEGHGTIEGSNGFLAIFLPWWIHDEYRVQLTDEEAEEVLKTKDEWERKALFEGFDYEGEIHKLEPEQIMWRRTIGLPEKCRGNIRKWWEEYPSTPREAFVASGDTFFDSDSLQAYEQKVSPPRFKGSLRKVEDRILPFRDPVGHLRIWEFPKPNGIYVIGADCSSGKYATSDPDDERGGRDFSCADVLDVKTKKQVAQFHGRVPPEVFAQALVNLGYFYRTAKIGPERNHSAGETVTQKIYDEYSYPNVYLAKQVNTKKDDRPTSRWGWWTTQVTRPIMLDELGESVRNQWLGINCPETIREMFTFIWHIKVGGNKSIPAAQEGTHDDRVMSMAIAWQLAISEPQEQPQGEFTEPEVFDSVSGAFDYGWSS